MANQTHYYSTPEAYQNHWKGVFEQLDDTTKGVVLEAVAKYEKGYLLISAKNGKYFIDGRRLDPNHPEEWGSIILSEIAQNLLRK
jgi:hypothetical protein